MDAKENILDAWIAIEKLSEGNIDLREGSNFKYKKLPRFHENWTDFFRGKVSDMYMNGVKPSKQSNPGFVLYFDIFNFEDLINKLTTKFELKDEYHDDNNAKKYTYCVAFKLDGDQFKLVENSLFYTMSGYAHRKGNLPANITDAQEQLSKCLAETFQYDFDRGMSKLIGQKTQDSGENYYEITDDVTNLDPFLHSFYVEDLEFAKGSYSENLTNYLFGSSTEKINLDSNKSSDSFNSQEIYKILEPKNYPLGRFPANPEWGLSLMQQIAVNIAINDSSNVRGVNGPPGTGKTTLLKDIFAEHTVRQAFIIANLPKKHLSLTETYFAKGKIAKLDTEISNNNILVASSNNGAVQNIVTDLPNIGQVDKQFLQDVLEDDYFTHLSDEDSDNQTWGLFAAEGGKKENVQKILTKIKKMSEDFLNDFEQNENAYNDFIKQYHLVESKRQAAQKLSDLYKEFLKVRTELEERTQTYNQLLIIEEDKCRKKIDEQKITLSNLRKLIEENKTNLSGLENHRSMNTHKISLEKDTIDVIKHQRPAAYWLLKLIQHPTAKAYKHKSLKAYTKLYQLLDQQQKIENACEQKMKRLKELQLEYKRLIDNVESIRKKFVSWKRREENTLRDLSQRVSNMQKDITQSGVEPLDLTMNYDELQQTNPWFTKEYRVEQSKLFMAALAVKKQFLYENQKSLKASYLIWSHMGDYAIAPKKHLISIAWDWINFAIPVIGTTFASFARMFKFMEENTIGNIYIDEAGQATPQSAVGAMIRGRRVMAVGDPAQIRPVVTLSNGVIGLIAHRYHAAENIINGYSSVQTLVDQASKFGYQKTEEEWVGIPIWVHRRSLNPMFSISNELSYQKQMVLPGNMLKPGKGRWVNIGGESNDKFVTQQGKWLKEKISHRKSDNIFVISPFKNVVNQLKKSLGKVGFDKSNIGTVHTFQGKETDIVYLVLGASDKEKGAALWAVSEPNLINVAATRAKREFYIIGDKHLYEELGSEVVDITLSVFCDYSDACEEQIIDK